MYNHRKHIFSAVTYVLISAVLVSCKTTTSNAAFTPPNPTTPITQTATRPKNSLIAQNSNANAKECPEVQEEAAAFLAPLAGSLLNAAASAGASFLLNYIHKKLKLAPPQQGAMGSTSIVQKQQPGTPGSASQTSPSPNTQCDKKLNVDYSADGLPAGIAYEVYQLDAEGNEEPVDPKSKVFNTGDKIFLLFTANLPGLIDVFNIDSQGDVKKIAEWEISAGDQVRLPKSGEIEFYKTTGDEKLSLYFYPCKLEETEAMRVTQNTQPVQQDGQKDSSSGEGGNAQKGDGEGDGSQSDTSSQVDPNAVALLTNCASIKRKTFQEKTEAMRVVADGNTNFGVSKLHAKNLKQSSGRPLVINIEFQHE